MGKGKGSIMKKISWLAAGLLAGAPVFAITQQIAYTGGKLVGSTEISMRSGDVTTGSYAISPDTVRFGTVFALRFFMVNDPLPAVCGARPMFAVQVLPNAVVRQRPDTSVAWSQYTTWSADTLVPVDSIGSGTNANPQFRAPGFNLVEAGGGNNCIGSVYILQPRWNRLVFLHRPTSGVQPYYGKVAVTAYRDTSLGILKSFTLTYVLNQQSGQSVDLTGGTVAIHAVRPARPSGGNARFGAGMEYDLYNPLGVRLRRDAGRHEPALPNSRGGSPRR
jgi:hypothetical protein